MLTLQFSFLLFLYLYRNRLIKKSEILPWSSFWSVSVLIVERPPMLLKITESLPRKSAVSPVYNSPPIERQIRGNFKKSLVWCGRAIRKSHVSEKKCCGSGKWGRGREGKRKLNKSTKEHTGREIWNQNSSTLRTVHPPLRLRLQAWTHFKFKQLRKWIFLKIEIKYFLWHV